MQEREPEKYLKIIEIASMFQWVDTISIGDRMT